MQEQYSALATRIAAAKGWDSTMREIMLAGKALPILPESLRSEENRVAGCQSQVWLARLPGSDNALGAWSDSKVIRGVLAVLLEKYHQSDHAPTDYQQYLFELGMERYLSESRTSGIRFVIARLATFT